MEYTKVKYAVSERVATISMDSPANMNAFDEVMLDELCDALAKAEADKDVKAVIINSTNTDKFPSPAFSAGGDVNWFRRGIEDPGVDLVQQVRRGADVLHQAIVDFKRIPFPVIAAVNGPAAGAGFSLALMCDIRIASEGAFFAVAYGRIGASPDGGMTYFLPRVIGPSAACELMLEDPNLTAADALERGLVSEVVVADELLLAAGAKAAELAAKSPHYQRMVKKLVWESLDNSLADHLQIERHGIAESMGTEDLQNGVRDFFAGEQPSFHGR